MKSQLLSHRIKIAALAAAFLAAPAFGGQLSKDLANVPSGTSVDVIVQFKTTPTTAMRDKVKMKGGTLKRQHANVRSALYNLTSASVADLVANTDVLYASPDREVKGSLDYANPAMNAPSAFSSGWVGNQYRHRGDR